MALCALPTMEDRISGINNFSPYDSTLSLSAHLFPSEDFPDRYAFVEGDYEFYFNGKLLGGYSTAFSVLRYEPDTYEAAKAFCVQQFTHTDEHQYQIGNYTFIEHLWTKSEDFDGNWVVKCSFPEMFNMYAYNDAAHTLLFLGYYHEDYKDASTQQALTDFEAFYNEHYGQYFELEGECK